MTAMLVYVTIGSPEEARSIARSVVSEKLAACANILDGMRSVYLWDGALQEDGESLLLLKTTAEQVPALCQRVIAFHSYSLPCVTALPITDGNPAFLAWISAQTNA